MVRQLTARELKARLENGTAKPLILDVREPWECQVCRLPDSTHIPMRDIPARATELSPESEIVVLCHHGIRSQQVAAYLARLGFARLYNLAGGIDAWAKDVDPDMATY